MNLMTTPWQRDHLQHLSLHAHAETPVFKAAECQRLFPELYLWDFWPVLSSTGGIACIDGAELWMALSADSKLHPDLRHDVARIRLITVKKGEWTDCGNLFPDNVTPGSREWAGCATCFPESNRLEVWYTASGLRDETSPSFVQRIFRAAATIVASVTAVRVEGWSEHHELVKPGRQYQSTLEQLNGEAGYIKAFRDPFRFTDPADGKNYVLFTASQIDSETEFDGVIGAAVEQESGSFELLEPLITADGVNNELERPHVVIHDDKYYLFFSMQARTFHPDISGGPTGLYGFVADSMDGDWQPLNGSGLVFSNPEAEPFQAYSWFVMQDLRAVGFVDFPNLSGVLPENVEGREYFTGTISPMMQLELAGAQAQITAGCEGNG